MKRATFLTLAAGSAGAVQFGFPLAGRSGGTQFSPNVWVTVDARGGVLVTIPMADIGQGVATALAMALADELDVDWSRVRVVSAEANKVRYGDQGIGGSRSMRKNTANFRAAGATARAMFVSAAAARWGVAANACRTARGTVYRDGTPSGVAYEALLADIASLDPPADPPLKTPDRFNYIGKPLPMLGAQDKCTGHARYGIDLTRPGMVQASIERAPRLGAALQRYDARAVRAVAGVVDVVELTTAPAPDVFPFVPSLAVVANSYWSALQGRKRLNAHWSDGPNAGVSSKQIRQELLAAVDAQAYTGQSIGDVDAQFRDATRIVRAVYETPLQAHATLEPQTALADVRLDSCEIWAPTQSPSAIHSTAAAITGLPLERVTVHQALAGGGFGRRSDIDYVVDAVTLSKKLGRPVKIIWTREDDFRQDVYRPPHVSRLRAVLDDRGNLVALEHRHVGPTIGIQRGYKKRHEVDAEALGGMIDIPYQVPNYRAEFVLAENVPLHFGWWRAVSEGQNEFATEVFVDELAHEANIGPYEFRRRLLASNPRALTVLDRAATRSGWSTSPQRGVGRGLAFAPYGKTYVAQVAEVRLKNDGTPRVSRVVCALDCGMPVNPRIIEAQIQGGIVWALGAALMHEITVENGAVVQGNFDTYLMPRMADVPQIEVEIVDSTSDPTGVGEAGVPALAPAVCNALFALTGKRVRRLPVRMNEID
jgi:CO/xanthine dehydrogenase Mo-binding subunit